MELTDLMDTTKYSNITIMSSDKTLVYLTDYAHNVFIHPKHGTFNSIRGWYYWHMSGCRYDRYKEAYGPGISTSSITFKVDKKALFKEAVILLLRQNQSFRERLKEIFNRGLPIVSYYTWNYRPKKCENTSLLIDVYKELAEELT